MCSYVFYFVLCLSVVVSYYGTSDSVLAMVYDHCGWRCPCVLYITEHMRTLCVYSLAHHSHSDQTLRCTPLLSPPPPVLSFSSFHFPFENVVYGLEKENLKKKIYIRKVA